MSHETENPLIIDVVGQVESSDPSESHSSKKAEKNTAKKGFFRKTASTATAQAATPEDVNAAKRAACEASVPRVDGPSPHPADAVGDVRPQQDRPPVERSNGRPQQTPPPCEQPTAAESVPQPQPVIAQPFPPQGYQVPAATAPRRSAAIYVFGILAILVMVFVVAAAGFYVLLHSQGRTELPATGRTTEVDEAASPMISSTFDQASKVSLRATVQDWNEETSTPLIVYIKRVDEGSSTMSRSSSSRSSSSAVESETSSLEVSDEVSERYFAFAPNKNASVSLPSGRYTFSFISPLNADGSLYDVPDMVDMVVGDGGTAVLPIDLVRIAADQVSDEQSSHALAQLKTAWETNDPSFDNEAFKKAVEAALGTWFSDKDTTVEEPATDLTAEQQASLDAQAASQDAQNDERGSGASTDQATSTEHSHDWVAQHEQRWEPSVVPVIDTPAWESPVYANFKCQEGILFQTLDECLAHVRERGNESYASSNEIIRIDYHPAIVHYEERGSFVDVLTGYRCSICGATGTL